MEWLREWAKPAVVIVAIGVFATCANNNINRRFDGMEQRFSSIDQRFDSIDRRFDGMDRHFDSMDNRLQAIEKTIFEMNTRLARIEGKLDIAVTAPGNELPPADFKK